jgi:hypothetical protein
MLAREERADFFLNGAVCIRNVFSPKQVDSLRAVYEPLIDGGHAMVMCNPDGYSPEQLSEEFLGIAPHPAATPSGDDGKPRNMTYTRAWPDSDVLQDFLRHSVCGRLASDLYSSELEVRLLYDSIVVKEAKCDSGSSWHADFRYWPFREKEKIVTVGISLDDVPREAGPVVYLRGSHYLNENSDYLSSSERAIDRIGEYVRRFEPMSWETRAGDVVIHHPKVIHGSTPNVSDHTRRNLVIRWMCGTHHFDPAGSPGGFLKRLMNDERFPIAVGDVVRGPNFGLVY